MPTKLSKYCDGIIEAAWLAAVIVVPVFFNVYSSRIFEPDKITLLRTIALVILAAWIVKLLDEGGFRWERVPRGSSWHGTLRQIPLILPVLAVAIVYVIYTFVSETALGIASGHMPLTIPFVLFGVMRLFSLLDCDNQLSDPTRLVIKDRLLIINNLLWAISVILIIYGKFIL